MILSVVLLASRQARSCGPCNSSHNSSKLGDPNPQRVSHPGSCKHTPSKPSYTLTQLNPHWHLRATLNTSSHSFLWGISALPLGVYVIAQDLNVPLIVQPQLFGLFSLLSWSQCMYYGGARSRAWCALVLGVTLVIWGALEAALVSALRVREPPQISFTC